MAEYFHERDSRGVFDYKSRSERTLTSTHRIESVDFSKFHSSLCSVSFSQPTSVTDEQNKSLAISIHLGKTRNLDYRYMDVDHRNWSTNMTFKFYEAESKWSSKVTKALDTDANGANVNPPILHTVRMVMLHLG